MPSYKFLTPIYTKASEHKFISLKVDSPNLVNELSEGQKVYSFVKLGSRPSGFTKYQRFLQRDNISLEERIQSKIPVLPWQDGYSYYNNYSSKDQDAIAIDPLVQIDVVSASETYSVQKIKLLEIKDEILLEENLPHIGGIRPKYHKDQIVLNESIYDRRGLWSFSKEDSTSFSENKIRNGTWVVTPLRFYTDKYQYYYEYDYAERLMFRDNISFNDKHIIGLKFGYDTINYQLLYYSQGGSRAVYRSDNISLDENWRNSSYKESDKISLYESKFVEGIFGKLRPEDIQVLEQNEEVHGRRVWFARDNISFSEQSLQLHGKMNFRHRLDIRLEENTPPFLRGVRDDLPVDDSYYDQDGLRNWYESQDIQVTERLVNDTPVYRDSWQVSDDWYKQTGIRVWLRTEPDIKFYDTGWMTTGSPRRTDTLQVSDSWYQRNGTYLLSRYREDISVEDYKDKLRVFKDATRYETVTYSERTELHGKISKRASDRFEVIDSKFFNIITERDDITFTDSYPPFRFEWKEKISLNPEWYSTKKNRDYFNAEEVLVLDRGALNDNFVVDIIEREDIRFTELAIPGGLTVKYKTETFYLWDNYYRPINSSPARTDTATLTDSANRNGKLVIPDIPLEEISVYEQWEVHGRRRQKGYDGAFMEDGSNKPKSPLMRDDLYVIDSYFFMPTQQDYFVMQESYNREDITQIIKMVDTYYLSNREWLRRDDYWLTEARDIKSGLTLRDKFMLGEKKSLERYIKTDFPDQEDIALMDKHKLFRKSDFLDITPVIYRDRPGRLRSSARLVLSPVDGQLYAVWADRLTNSLQYARKPYNDSWRTHTRTRIDLPNVTLDKRSVTLAFSDNDPTPIPMIEANGHIMQWNGTSWDVIEQGHDVATHPVTGEYVYITPNRYIVKIGATQEIELSTRGRIVQSYTGSDPGLYVVDDLNRLIKTIGTPPLKHTEPAEEVASTRWDVLYDGETYSRGWIPVEGVITEGRI